MEEEAPPPSATLSISASVSFDSSPAYPPNAVATKALKVGPCPLRTVRHCRPRRRMPLGGWARVRVQLTPMPKGKSGVPSSSALFRATVRYPHAPQPTGSFEAPRRVPLRIASGRYK